MYKHARDLWHRLVTVDKLINQRSSLKSLKKTKSRILPPLFLSTLYTLPFYIKSKQKYSALSQHCTFASFILYSNNAMDELVVTDKLYVCLFKIPNVKAKHIMDDGNLHHSPGCKTNSADCISRHKHNKNCCKNYPFSPHIPSDKFLECGGSWE